MSEKRPLRGLRWGTLLARLDADLARTDADPDGERDEAAWKELRCRAKDYASVFARTPFALMKTALSPSELDDVVQDVCIKLQKRKVLAQLRRARKPAGYLVRMLRNKAGDHLKGGSHRWTSLPPEELFAWERDDLPTADESRKGRALKRALRQLSDKERELYQGRYEENRSIGDIAADLGIRYWTAAGRLRRMEKRVRKLMESRKRTP